MKNLTLTQKIKTAVANYIYEERGKANYDRRICINVISDIFRHYVDHEDEDFNLFLLDISNLSIPENVEKHEGVNYDNIFNELFASIHVIIKNVITFEKQIEEKKNIEAEKAKEIIIEKVVAELRHYRDFHFKSEFDTSSITRSNFNSLIDEITYIIYHKTI